MTGGTPVKTRAGNVRKVPPPAIVFRIPAPKAARVTSMISARGMSVFFRASVDGANGGIQKYFAICPVYTLQLRMSLNSFNACRRSRASWRFSALRREYPAK
jgi:hypothetical protein